MAAYDDLNTKRIFIVGILSILVTAATALAVQVVYYWLVSMHEADLAEKSSYRRQNQVIIDQTDEISNYGVDPDTGNVTIPVSEAMQLIAANSGGAKADEHSGDATDDHDHKKVTDGDEHPKE